MDVGIGMDATCSMKRTQDVSDGDAPMQVSKRPKQDRHDVRGSGTQGRTSPDHDDSRNWARPAGKLKRLSHEKYTVGWICALHTEMAASRAMLDEIHLDLPRHQNDTNQYVLGSIHNHNIAIACLPSGRYGTNNAAAVASNLYRTFASIRLCLLVGIGGGCPGRVDVRLGDVVVSTEVVQYDLGKTVRDGGFQRTGVPCRPPHAIMTAVNKLRAIHECESCKVPALLSQMLRRFPSMTKYTRHAELRDWLFDSDYIHGDGLENCDDCDQSMRMKRIVKSSESPEIHYGAIASGNSVIKDGKSRDRLAQELGNICFEMEAAGLTDDYPWLVIRGICDHADSHKNKKWQEYAAATSAAYAKELLSVMDVPEMQSINPATMQHLEDRRQTLMEALSFDQIDVRRLTIKKADSTTCRWLLDHHDYIDWLDPEKLMHHHGFLWLNGKPGAGKSTLMKFAYDCVNKGTTEQECCISFFFNARGEDLEKSTLGMQRSLLLQLLKKFPDLQEVLNEDRLFSGNYHLYSSWTIELLQEVFSAAVARLGQRQLTCFIDALDECDEQQVRDMVAFFQDLGRTAVQSGNRLFVCFSSRHYPSINIENGIQLILEDQVDHREDLTKYVRSHLKAGKAKSVEEIRAQILEKANGIFLWVVLVVEILNQEFLRGRIFAVKRRLHEIPAKLSDLFKDILRRDNANMKDLLLCVQWILFAKRPLKREEFYFALLSGLEPDSVYLAEWEPEQITTEMMNRFVLSSSKGLAELTKSKSPTVQFIHESVRDFLVKDGGLYELWPELDDLHSISHDRLKLCCQTYICVDISAHAAFEESSSTASSNAAKSLRQRIGDKFPFLEYATKYVLHHANQAADKLPQEQFMQQLPLNTWINLNNLFEKHEIRRCTASADLLYILAEKDLANLIKIRLEADPDIDIQGERYQYPLFAALANQNQDAFNALLQREKNLQNANGFVVQNRPNFRVVKGEPPLVWAAREGHDAVVGQLLERGVDIEARDRHDQTPLLVAACYGHEATVLHLLGKGADIQARDRESSTPLARAAEAGHAAVVRQLLERGADIETTDNTSYTPLLFAVRNGHAAVVRQLLGRGANVNIAGRHHGCTPLFYAVQKGYTAIVQLLLEKGANTESIARSGLTPRELAAKMGHEAILKLLESEVSNSK